MKKLRPALWILPLFMLIFPLNVRAQESPESQFESCFKYYDYGKVKVNISSDTQTYSAGGTIKFSGIIENKNKFPVTDSVLYGQLKRINDTDYDDNGHYLVDRITLLSDLAILPGESKSVSFDLPVKASYPPGDYQMQYFIFTPDGIHYSGRPFLEEDTAGVTNFGITLPPERDAVSTYFDLNSLTVNGVKHNLREQIVKYPVSNLTIKLGLNSQQSREGIVNAKYSIYKYEDTDERNLVETKNIQLTAANNYSMTVNFSPKEGGAFVLVAGIDDPNSSILKYRFAVPGENPSEVKIADLNINAFPVGDETMAYLCFHSAASEKSKVTDINLEVLDSGKQIVEQKTVSSSVSSDVAAIALPLNVLKDKNDFYIRGSLTGANDKGVGTSIEKHFSCDTFKDAVSDMKIELIGDTGNTIMVNTTDGCGNKVPIKNIIESVKIYKGSQLVSEEYNVVPELSGINVNKLPPGEYIAEVKQGVKVASAKFTVKGYNQEKAIKLLAIMAVLGLILLGAMKYAKNKKPVKKTVKPYEKK